jgi:hypothetical protein
MELFEGFQPGDFDAFEERKWTSHAFNRERLEAKLKLTALGKALEAALVEDLTGLESGLTDERPSVFNQQRVSSLSLFFHRDSAARQALDGILDRSFSMQQNVLDSAPHHRHAALVVRLGPRGLTAGLFLHRQAWVDWKNAQERCRKYGESERLEGLLQALPEGVRLAVGEELPADAPEARRASAAEFLTGFESAEPYTILAQPFSREQACLGCPDALPEVGEALRAVLPVFRFVAWSRQNDHHQVKAVIQEHREKVEKKFQDLRAGDEVRIARGLAAGKIGVVDAIERKGQVKVRIGPMLVAVKMDDLVPR